MRDQVDVLRKKLSLSRYGRTIPPNRCGDSLLVTLKEDMAESS